VCLRGVLAGVAWASLDSLLLPVSGAMPAPIGRGLGGPSCLVVELLKCLTTSACVCLCIILMCPAGVVQRTARSQAFPPEAAQSLCFHPLPESQPVLPCLLRRLLQKGRAVDALELARWGVGEEWGLEVGCTARQHRPRVSFAAATAAAPAVLCCWHLR
jgi:hypothetical protein